MRPGADPLPIDFLDVPVWPHRRPVLVWVLCLSALVVGTFLQLGRQVGVPATDSIWAEDGRVFLTDALSRGPSVFFEPYRGYLLVFPRLLTSVAGLLPLELAAVALSASSALVVSALSIYVVFTAAASIPSLPARLILGAFMVVVPQGWLETTSNTANLHWFLLFAGYWALLAQHNSRAGRFLDAIIVAAAGLSDPLGALLLPFALFRARRMPELRGGRQLAWVLALSVLVQIGGLLVSSGLPQESDSRAADLPSLYALRVGVSFLIGDRLLTVMWPSLGWALALGGVGLLGALAAHGLRHAHPNARQLALECFALSVALFTTASWIRGTTSMLPQGDVVSFSASRFVVIAVLFLAAAFTALFSGPRGVRSPYLWHAGQSLLGTVFLVTIVTNYRLANPRSDGPRWSVALAAARVECVEADTAYVSIPISPAGPPGFWRVRAPCGRVLR